MQINMKPVSKQDHFLFQIVPKITKTHQTLAPHPV